MAQTVGQGGNITLRVQYQAGNGLPTDPQNPSVSILDPASNVIETGTPTKESTGTYFYTFNVANDAALGDWVGRFTGTINSNPVSGDDLFTVVASGVVIPLVPNPLITLAELKTALNVDPTDTRKDALYEQAITFASKAIVNFADRDFGQLNVTEERLYEYDGSGYLSIDDAIAVDSVSLTVPGGNDVLLSEDQWRALPTRRDDSPVFWYIHMPGVPGTAVGSGAMGFTYNLDVLHSEGRWRALPTMVKVIATWGWPDVPADVKQAAVWTIEDWTSKQGGEALAAEAIEGFSRSWASRGGTFIAQAIPNRARDILVHYQRQQV